MKNQFTLLFLLIGLLGFSQDTDKVLDEKKPQESIEKMVQALDKEVDLSDVQGNDIRDILFVGHEEMQAIRQKYKNTTIEPMKAEIQHIKEKYAGSFAENKDKAKGEISAVRAKYGVQLRNMKGEIGTIRKATKSEIHQVLSPTQLERLKKVNTERREQFKRRLEERKDQRKGKKRPRVPLGRR